MVSDVQKNIMEQINWQLLAKRGFRFVGMDENTVRLNFGHKNMDIRYMQGSDTYTIEKHTILKGETKITKVDGVYFDDLNNIIDEFFNLKGFVKDVKGLTRARKYRGE